MVKSESETLPITDAGLKDVTASSSTANDNRRTDVPASLRWEDRILVVRHHFEQKGYRVHSGLQFGTELVLYADEPSQVHSDFCVHVVQEDGSLDWRQMQSLVRSMPDLHKTLILANVRRIAPHDDVVRTSPIVTSTTTTSMDDNHKSTNEVNGTYFNSNLQYHHYEVDEIALATEHAPFRHKKRDREVGMVVVGTQRKTKQNQVL